MSDLLISSAYNSLFQTLTNSMLGLNITGTSSKETDIQKANALWGEFLLSLGNTFDTAFIKQNGEADTSKFNTWISTASSTDTAKCASLYNEFIAEKLNETYQAGLLLLQTKDEQLARDIIFETMTKVLHMLSVLQQTMRASSDALVFYTQMQQEYTEMLQHISLKTLVDGGLSVTLNTTDVGETILGKVENITVRDLVEYVNQLRTTGTPTTYIDGFPCWKFATSPFVINPASGSTEHVGGIEFFIQETWNNSLYFRASPMNNGTISSSPPEFLFEGTVSQSSTNVVDDIIAQATQYVNEHPTYQHWWNSSWITYPALSSFSSFLKDETKKSDENKLRQSQRSEANGQLQLYISNAQANRDLIQSASKPIENLINQTREAIQGQLTLMNSMIELVKGLISAVTRT